MVHALAKLMPSVCEWDDANSMLCLDVALRASGMPSLRCMNAKRQPCTL